jgi:hypothetical protein
MTDAVHPDQPADVPYGGDPGETIDNPMQYIDSHGETVVRHKNIESVMSDAYGVILANCPQSAERTLAIRKLQEVRMWCNAAIVFDGRRYRL